MKEDKKIKVPSPKQVLKKTYGEIKTPTIRRILDKNK